MKEIKPAWIFTFCLIFVTIAFDIWLWHTDQDTISRVIMDANSKFISPSFFIGVLVGHFFWGQEKRKD